MSDWGEDTVSKHAGGMTGECYNCGEVGHNSADCPNERVERPFTGECFNCGEVGHSKADCTNERVDRPFTGTCNFCQAEGHRASECPEKPPSLCRACKRPGHNAFECSESRDIYDSSEPAMEPDAAWAILVDADKVKDIDGFKKALFAYTRASPSITFVEVEHTLREDKFNTYLIAKEQDISSQHTIVNLQGKIDCKYVMSIQLSSKPVRAKFATGWPSSPEENLQRLEDAGIVMDRLVQKCSNCGELGHGSKRCTQEVVEKEKVEITCMNCKEHGHRLRDCTKPREDRNACRNCKQSGHKASDCPEPRSAEGVECKACGETGHFARDCPTKEPDTCRRCGEEGHRAADCSQERVVTCRNCNQEGHMSRECPEPRNPVTMTCRNCEKVGHLSRECDQPRDYSKVQCSNCSEFGHTKVRCKAPPKEDDAAGVPNGVSGGWENGDGAASGGGEKGWESEAPVVSSGGW